MSHHVYNRTLPLAVYREIMAHLQQIQGITVHPIAATSQTFNYADSQIQGLEIGGLEPDLTSTATGQRVDQILAYYSDRYGTWEPPTP